MDLVTEYQVFDVTDFINNGDNVLAAQTGNGWYNCASWGTLSWNVPAVIMQLEIEYSDSTKEVVSTDNTWSVTASPLEDNDIQYGERYDAREEIDGWNDAVTPSGEWVNAQEVTISDLKPFAKQDYPAVKVQQEVRAVTMGSLSDGTTYYDFGFNSSGRAKIVLKDTKPGEVVIIRYCELLQADNTPYIGAYSDVYFEKDNLPTGRAPFGARNIDVYICKGAKQEVYTPEFAYTGFRYVYISGYSGEYTLGTVRKMEMNTDLEEVGDFETSNEGLSTIWDAVKRSYRSNIVTGPTDCPTREKNFWNGDIQVFAHTACWYMDNENFLSRWTQSGRKIEYGVYGWEDEEYLLPLTLYDYYGNTEIIKAKYPVVQNLIAKRKAQLASGQLLPTDHAQYGDHQAIVKVPEDFFAASYYCLMYKEAARMAEILGKTEDAQNYLSQFETLRNAFNEKYYLADMHDYSPKCQSGIVLPLAFGIADEENGKALAATLHTYLASNDYKLTTGFMATEHLLSLLCDYGYADDAWKNITGTEYPSLLNMLSTNTGGTTTENWVGYKTVNGSSMNHYAVGNSTRWFFEYLGGIKMTSPGFDTIQLKPYFYKELGDCRVTYNSKHGTIASEWYYSQADDTFAWTVTVPEGVTATCSVPKGFVVMENGEEKLGKTYTLTGCVYTFTVKTSANTEEQPDLSVLKDKNIVCIGDSLTEGDYGSNPAGTMNVHAENYPYFLGTLTGANVQNAGKCGYSPMRYWNSHLSVPTLSESTNIVLIMLGTNEGLTDTLDADTAFNSSADYAQTQTGYYARLIEYCREKTKGQAQIILMTPPVTTKRDRTRMETTVSVVKKLAVKYGLNVIDNYNSCGITYDNIETYMPIDQLHCGYDGYMLLASYVASQASLNYADFVPEQLPDTPMAKVTVIDGVRTAFVKSDGISVIYGGSTYGTFDTMNAALSALGKEGGRIVVSGEFKENYDGATIGANGFKDIAGRAPLVIEGADKNAVYNFNYAIVTQGDTTFGKIRMRQYYSGGKYLRFIGKTVLSADCTWEPDSYVAYLDNGNSGSQYNELELNSSGRYAQLNVCGFTNVGTASTVTPALSQVTINDGRFTLGLNLGSQRTAANTFHGNANLIINGGTHDKKTVDFKNITTMRGKSTVIFNNDMAEGFTVASNINYIVKSASGGMVSIKENAPFGGAPTFLLVPDDVTPKS